MENYDEKMNYSFEPAPEEPSRPPLEQAKEEIRRSGKHTRLKIAALLAALAIVAAVGGTVLTKTIDAIGQKNLAEQEKNASVGVMAEQQAQNELEGQSGQEEEFTVPDFDGYGYDYGG